LQAMLLGVLTADHTVADLSSIICATDDAGDSGRLPQHEGHDCGACVLACAGGTPLPRSVATAWPVPTSSLVRLPTLWFEALPLPSRHKPQASRAPPSSL
jgi:hypothetical protein